MKKIAVVLASILVAACASSKTDSHLASQSNDKTPSATASAATNSVSAAQVQLDNLSAELKKLETQSDYFDYNKYIVKSEYQDILQKEAAFLKEHRNDVVTLEGNADERGSDSYNFVLGDKRAEAVAKSLEKLGVPAAQLKVVSLGKKKARLTCHAEQCWKENRRVDFIHKLS